MVAAGGNKDRCVFALSRSSRCFACDRKLPVNEIVQLHDKEDDREVFCLHCAKLDHLERLPTGNAKLTRLAKKYSTVTYLIMKWSDTWKCYERQGLLVESAALEKARKELVTLRSDDKAAGDANQ